MSFQLRGSKPEHFICISYPEHTLNYLKIEFIGLLIYEIQKMEFAKRSYEI